MARAVGFNRPQVQQFFTIYKDVLEAGSYGPTKVWNMDETGVSTVQTPGRVVASKGVKRVGKITSAERGKLVTVLCASNAAGSYTPPPCLRLRPRQDDPQPHERGTSGIRGHVCEIRSVPGVVQALLGSGEATCGLQTHPDSGWPPQPLVGGGNRSGAAARCHDHHPPAALFAQNAAIGRGRLQASEERLQLRRRHLDAI